MRWAVDKRQRQIFRFQIGSKHAKDKFRSCLVFRNLMLRGKENMGIRCIERKMGMNPGEHKMDCCMWLW